MTSAAEVLERAVELARTGDMASAFAALDTALAEQSSSLELLEFKGFLAVRAEDHFAAADAYRRVLAIDPSHMAARINLATALVALGDFDEAAGLCAGRDDPKLQRLAAYLEQRRGDNSVATYRDVVATDPNDGESWNNLGNALLGVGNLDDALVAFDRAIQLRPDALPIYFNYANALFLAERHEARRQLMRQAASYAPDDPQVLQDLGLAEAACGDMVLAEAALRAAIAARPEFSRAFVELGLLLENLNRIDDLAALIDEGRRRDPDAPELAFLTAWLERRRGDPHAALAMAEQVPETIHPLRRFQLIADLNDRLGAPDRAFAGFTAMNQAAIGVQRPLAGPTYREMLAATLANATREGIAAWPVISVDRLPPSPIFIVGFPRSGTTLLDTLLMNVPNVRVLEELPALNQATMELGHDEAGLATLDSRLANSLRADYFDRVEAVSPGAAGKIIIDKHPLHMTRIATIHRLFPDARIVLVERHPCDAVLSCFMANFQQNVAMRSFTTLEETAHVYDAAFTIWENALALWPEIRATRVRYERMVGNLESEMRMLLNTLDLPWTDDVLDNQKSAASRERVRTASYAQITEPVYQRAVARWERYREHLAPVTPILTPWAQRMGYSV